MKLAIRRGVEPNNFGALGFITLVKDMAMKKNDKNNFPVNCMHFSPPGGIFPFPFFLSSYGNFVESILPHCTSATIFKFRHSVQQLYLRKNIIKEQFTPHW